MQNAAQYLEKTRSAAARLFEGIDGYLALLREHPATFAASYSNSDDLRKQYETWCTANESKIKADLQAQRRYLGEAFAQATLCGAILQLAAKAIECYSKNDEVSEDWAELIKPGSKPVRFCIGRDVRGVPLGLVIHAGRNQHMHFEDDNLREPNVEVFRRLAVNHQFGKGRSEPVVDPAFHLGTTSITSFANNITALIGWRSLDAYETDMRTLLET
jgi:hypothetical protein